MNDNALIEITNPFHLILLENEPILNIIEEELTIEKGTFSYIENKYISSEDSSLLKHCMVVFKKEADKFETLFFKVKIGPRFNEELVLNHLTILSEQIPNYRGLKFRRLPIEPQEELYDYIVYTKPEINQNGIQLFQKTINKINVFSAYYELVEIPELFRTNFIEICTVLQKNQLTTIPSKIDIDAPPSIFGFEHNFKPFIQFITKIQRNVFPCIKIKPTKALTFFHKSFYEERFTTLTRKAQWEINNINFKTTFTEIKPGIFDCYVKAPVANIKTVAARVTEFFNGIVLVIVMKSIQKNDEKDLLSFSRNNTTPYNALYFINYGDIDQMVAVVNLSKEFGDINLKTYKEELKDFIYGMYTTRLEDKEEFEFEEIDVTEIVKTIPKKTSDKIDKLSKKEEEKRKKEQEKKRKEEEKRKKKHGIVDDNNHNVPKTEVDDITKAQQDMEPNNFVEYNKEYFVKQYEEVEFENEKYYNDEYNYDNYQQYDVNETNFDNLQQSYNDLQQEQYEGYYDENGEYHYYENNETNIQYQNEQNTQYDQECQTNEILPPLPPKPKRLVKEDINYEQNQKTLIDEEEIHTQVQNDYQEEYQGEIKNEEGVQEEYQEEAQEEYQENIGNEEGVQNDVQEEVSTYYQEEVQNQNEYPNEYQEDVENDYHNEYQEGVTTDYQNECQEEIQNENNEIDNELNKEPIQYQQGNAEEENIENLEENQVIQNEGRNEEENIENFQETQETENIQNECIEPQEFIQEPQINETKGEEYIEDNAQNNLESVQEEKTEDVHNEEYIVGNGIERSFTRRPTRTSKNRKPPTKKLFEQTKTMKTEILEEEIQNEEIKQETNEDSINEETNEEIKEDIKEKVNEEINEATNEVIVKEETKEETTVEEDNEVVGQNNEIQQNEEINENKEEVKEEGSEINEEDNTKKEEIKKRYSNPNKAFLGDLQKKIQIPRETKNVANQPKDVKEDKNTTPQPFEFKLKKATVKRVIEPVQEEETELQKALKRRRGNN